MATREWALRWVYSQHLLGIAFAGRPVIRLAHCCFSSTTISPLRRVKSHQIDLLYTIPLVGPLPPCRSILGSPYFTSRNALITRFLVHAPATCLMPTKIVRCKTSTTAPYYDGSERARRHAQRSCLAFTPPHELYNRLWILISIMYSLRLGTAQQLAEN